MKTKKFFPLIVLFCFISLMSLAQTDTTSESENKETAFKIGAYYNSGLNYYGRTDSLRSSGFFPMAELWLSKNFYLTAAPVFVHNSATSFEYAGTVATAGFQFIEENKWFGNIYLVKPFYQSNSQLVQSALKAQGSMSLSWLNKYLNVTGGGDIKLSDKFDFGVTAGLDHIFRFPLPGNSVFVADPSAYLNAGTQQFTNSYYKRSNSILFPGIEQSVKEDVKTFNILSYEFSAPLIFSKGKFQILVTPAYVIPQNLVVVPGRPDLSERGKEMFYTTIGAKISL